MGSARVRLAAAGLLLALLAGCSSTWGRNRLEDLTDVVHAGIGFYCLGVHANVGPLVLGAGAYGSPHDKRAGLSCLGPGGISSRSIEGGVIGVGIPLRLADVPAKRGSQALGDRKQPPQYGDTWPPWGSVGAEVFLLLCSLSVRFDVVECADFVAGLLFLDPAGGTFVAGSPARRGGRRAG
jgi:hypothetical protein